MSPRSKFHLSGQEVERTPDTVVYLDRFYEGVLSTSDEMEQAPFFAAMFADTDTASCSTRGHLKSVPHHSMASSSKLL